MFHFGLMLCPQLILAIWDHESKDSGAFPQLKVNFLKLVSLRNEDIYTVSSMKKSLFKCRSFTCQGECTVCLDSELGTNAIFFFLGIIF